jgi:hypothetical protein
MAKSPKSFLLEQLRAQADAVAVKRVQQLRLYAKSSTASTSACTMCSSISTRPASCCR